MIKPKQPKKGRSFGEMCPELVKQWHPTKNGNLTGFAEFERALISERTKEDLRRVKMNGKKLGRPKGSKDKKKRSNKGYVMRELKKRKIFDKKLGIYRPLTDYIK